ncbi:hypothetical protein RhiirC2_782123 [Rhizophagus irregularis]|uniref:Uncharacterized protein n=1 Tax=Rhizophagus irregularis TaxID=588596 RepID=A0A2N1N3V8_9GLOM|nr:hypothetical protein RhiirC2_782123 [Rhizophagus irregularis]
MPISFLKESLLSFHFGKVLVFFRYGSQNLTPFLFLNKVLLPFHFGKVLVGVLWVMYWYLLRSFYWQFGFFVVEALEFFRCGS